MVRNYKRKRPPRWRNKDKRMAAAVRLRTGGMSLRQIATALAVAHETVRRDLARWDAQQAAAVATNVVSLSQKLSHRTVTNDPARGELRQPDVTENVTGRRAL